MSLAAKLVAALAVALLVAGPAAAQDAGKDVSKPASRCGGIVCDLYYAGVPDGQPSPTALPCRDFVCGMFGGRTPDQPVAAAEPVPAAPESLVKRKAVKKRVARAQAVKEAAPKPVATAQ